MKIHELGHVVLYVTNLEQSAHFYREVLGFPQIKSTGEMMRAAAFTTGRTHHELLLIEIGGSPKAHHGAEPGLYHIGFKIGDTDKELKEAYRELQERGVRIVGSSDHGVTHSLYILDPDGNELELYIDVNDSWREHPEAVFSPIQALNLD